MVRNFFYLFVCLILVAAPTYSLRQRSVAIPKATSFYRDLDSITKNPLDEHSLGELALSDPVEFLKQCLNRCHRDVKGYEAILNKQERLEGVLYAPETLQVAFQDTPHRVRLEWIKGTRRASKVLYAQGENQDRLLIQPAGWIGVVGIVERDPYGPETRQNGRYPLPEFGIKRGMLRTLQAWLAARERGTLDVRLEGIQKVPLLENRPCYIFHRTNYDIPEDDGIEDLIVYIDQETGLQTGSILRDGQKNLLAEYYLTQLKLNPDFAKNTFTRDGLRK